MLGRMRRGLNRAVLGGLPGAVITLAMAAPVLWVGETVASIPPGSGQSRVQRMAECVQRAAREFCRVPAATEPATCVLGCASCDEARVGPVVESAAPHARRVVMDVSVVDLPPPVL